MRNGFTLAKAGAIAVLAVILAVTGGRAIAADKVKTARVEGRTVAYRVLGSGGPVLVMISGLGDDMTSFQAVAAELSKDSTVILYDRAGYGGSARAPGARDAEAIDRELSAMLPQTGVKGPYILLGHSLSGQYAEYYAARHPDQVAGLILEEARPADFTHQCQAAGVKMCMAPSLLMAFLPSGAKAELAAAPATEAQVEAIGPVRGKPVLVLSRPLGANASPFDAAWAAGQARLAARYPGARHLIAAKSGHYLHVDQKDWFVTTVRAFVNQTGTKTH